MGDFGKFMFGLILKNTNPPINIPTPISIRNWLLVPSLDVGELNYTSGVAISTFLMYVKHKVPREEKEPSIKELLKLLGKKILNLGFLLFIGWVVSLFI